MVHRDVKSANVLLDRGNNPKLCDFGLLRHAVSGEGQTVTQTMNVVCTPIYIAPEASRGDVSAKMDVWSLGVVLLELLTNQPVWIKNRFVLHFHLKYIFKKIIFFKSHYFIAISIWYIFFHDD